MNRREFLKFSALLAMASAASPLPATAWATPRYIKPDPLTDPDEKLLLTNASIIDVHTGMLREENQILIQNGRIADLFLDSGSEVTADYTVDIDGAYVTPGLINAPCHISMQPSLSLDSIFKLMLFGNRQVERNAEECIKHGVTTVRDMAANGDKRYWLKKKIARGKFVGPRIFSSYVLEVENGYMSGGGGDRIYCYKTVNTPEEAVEGVLTAVKQEADLIKIAHQAKTLVASLPDPKEMSFEITQAICEEAERQGLIVAMHCTNAKGLNKSLAAGVTSFEHIVWDRELTQDEIDQMVNKNIYVVPTASVGHAISWETGDDPGWDQGFRALMKAERDQLMPEMIHEYLEPDLVASAIKIFNQYNNPEYWNKSELKFVVNVDATNTILTHGISNMRTLYNAGVKFGCGNDGGIPLDAPGAMGLEMYILELLGMGRADKIWE